MNTIISARDIEDLLAQGGDLKSLPADAIYTPSAKDLLRDRQRHNGAGRGSVASSLAATATAPTKPLTSKSSKTELEGHFNSPYCHALKEQLCDIGRRLWQRAYVDGNGGKNAIPRGEGISLW